MEGKVNILSPTQLKVYSSLLKASQRCPSFFDTSDSQAGELSPLSNPDM